MTKGERGSASEFDEHDNLEAIEGIGPPTAAALHNIGIYRFADLAQYTPKALSDALNKQSQMEVMSKKAEKWIEQARALISLDPDYTPTVEEVETIQDVEVVKLVEEGTSLSQWQQHAGFSVRFDSRVNELGKQVWQTRVSQYESGEEARIPGNATLPWVSWMLEQAKIPVAAQLIPTTPESLPLNASGISESSDNVRLEILNVQVSEVAPSFGASTKEKKLASEVRFSLAGDKAETLAADHTPFQIWVYIVDLNKKTSNLIASEEGHLQTREFEYTSRREFSAPSLGRYEFHSIVLLLPPNARMACHQGPILKVVP